MRPVRISFKLLNQRSCSSLAKNDENLFLETEASTLQKNYAGFKKHLKAQNINYKDGFTCLQVECRLCTRVQQATGYINKRTGIFLCPSCNIRKPLNVVQQLYENRKCLADSELNASSLSFLPQEALERVPEEICKGLHIKGLTVADVDAVGAQYSHQHKTLHFPLKNAANIILGQKVYNLEQKTEKTQQNAVGGLLMHTPATHKSKAILVTNVIDFLAVLAERIETHSIICLPDALNKFPQECLPCLERYKELVFWFNFDICGWDTTRAFANKMDEKRCLFIRPTDNEPSPFLAQKRRLNLRHILQKATPVSHKSITTFHTLRNDILSEMQNIEKVNGVKWKRFPILNKLLKGHRKGELTIISGPTGSGKTTFMSEYSLDLALQGVSSLWGSFEIRNTRLASTLLRQYAGYSLENKLHEFDHWANEFEKYPIYFMTFHGQQPLKVVMEAIEHARYVHDINHVIIDNLQFMMGLSQSYRSDKFWEQDTIIATFRSFATQHNVHVTLVMHPRKEREENDLTVSSIFGSAKATQEADNVLIIQDKRLTSLRGKKYLQIVKNRYSGDLGIMPLDFDKESLSYAKKKKTVEKTN